MNSLFDAAGLTVFERGWLSSNNVLFAGDDAHGSTLVDSGYCTHAEQTVALVRQALGTRPLERLVNTHLHSDHCGGNHALQVAFECSIAVPAGEASKVDEWNEDELTYRATGQQCPRFSRTESVRAGDEVWCGRRRWQAIAAPGHDPESFVLYEPELQLLISADALWENGFGVVFPELEGVSAFDDVRSTLDRLSGLPVRWSSPGTGVPLRTSTGRSTAHTVVLIAFVADPTRHAQHAAKVLIKFHLLEVQQVALAELMEWLSATPYMRLTHQRHFDAIAFEAWCTGLLTSRSGMHIKSGRERYMPLPHHPACVRTVMRRGLSNA
jgi:glyoxylase-like metal-dependent hydrolase (beta-lactamase superfamily II)